MVNPTAMSEPIATVRHELGRLWSETVDGGDFFVNASLVTPEVIEDDSMVALQGEFTVVAPRDTYPTDTIITSEVTFTTPAGDAYSVSCEQMVGSGMSTVVSAYPGAVDTTTVEPTREERPARRLHGKATRRHLESETEMYTYSVKNPDGSYMTSTYDPSTDVERVEITSEDENLQSKTVFYVTFEGMSDSGTGTMTVTDAAGQANVLDIVMTITDEGYEISYPDKSKTEIQVLDTGSWIVMEYDSAGTIVSTVNYEYTFEEEAFCLEYEEFCVSGFPDLVAVCDDIWAFPYGTFDGTSFLSVCDVDYDYACSIYPELCVEESFSTNLCGIYPEMCDTTAATYNECAADLYSCLMSPDFFVCDSFPELCGFITDIEVPEFMGVPKGAGIRNIGADSEGYFCKGVIKTPWYEVEMLVETLNGVFDANIYPGELFSYDITVSSTAVHVDGTVSEILAPTVATIDLVVPEINLGDDKEAAADFDKIYGEVEGYFDMLGFSYEFTEWTDSTGEMTAAFTEVDFGFAVPADQTEEDIHVGIWFKTELPSSAVAENASLISWAKYERLSEDKTPTGEAAAVACIVNYGVDGVVSDVEAKTYEWNDLDIASIDDPNLEALEVLAADSVWQLQLDQKEFYAVEDEFVSEGNSLQNCVLAFPFTSTADSADDFGFYKIESGARHIAADATVTDFTRSKWEAFYRPPVEAVENEVQVQFASEAVKDVSYTDADSGATVDFTSKMNVYVGYEIIKEFEADNKMGFIMEVDVSDKLTKEGAVIYQYVQFRKMHDFQANWQGIGCAVSVGGQAEVINYNAYDLDLQTSATLPFWEAYYSQIQDYTEDSEAPFFTERDDEEAYSLEYGEGYGIQRQTCIAQLDFPKFGMEEFFGDYEIIFGARYYASYDNMEPLELVAGTYDEQHFGPPIYDDEIQQEIVNLFKQQHIPVFQRRFEFDAGQAFTGTATEMMGYQNIWGELIVSPDEFANQIFRIQMETEVPIAYAQDLAGQVVLNWLKMQPVNETASATDPLEDPAIVVCRTTVDEAYARKVDQYVPDFDIAAMVEQENTAATLDVTESFFTASKDFMYYETYDDGEAWGYANCAIELVLSEANRDMVGDLFERRYEVTYGVKLFADADAVQGTEVSTVSEFGIFLEYPIFEEPIIKEVEQKVAEQFFLVDLGTDEVAYHGFDVAFKTSPYYSEDDILRFTLFAELPPSVSADAVLLQQWVQFRSIYDIDGDWTTVSCNQEIGAGADGATVQTFAGQTAFDAAALDADATWTKFSDFNSGEEVPTTMEEAFFKADNSTAYKEEDSPIPDNLYYSCVAEMIVPKVDRDESMFGFYDVKAGVRTFAAVDSKIYTTFSEVETDYELVEPMYDETMDYSDQTYSRMIDYKEWALNITDGRAQQRLYADFYVNPVFTVDDTLVLNLELDLPAKILQDDIKVMQYVQLIPKGEDPANFPLMSGACLQTVNGDRNRIANYMGFGRLDAANVQGNFTEQNADDRLRNDDVDAIFSVNEEYGEFYTYDSWVADENRVASCALAINISKEDRTEDLFQEWRVYVGARVFTSQDTFRDFGERKFNIMIEDVDPDAPVVDQEVLDFFEEEKSFATDEKKETEVLAVKEKTVDAADTLGSEWSGFTAGQTFYAALETNEKLDKPDLVSFFFDLDLPTDFATDGKIISQFAELTDQNGNVDPFVIECTVQVGNPEATRTKEFIGTVTENETGVDYKSQSFGTENVDSTVKSRDDEDFYALKKASTWENSIQSCLAQIEVPKIDREEALFTTYSVKIGARVFEGRTDTAPKDFGITEFEVTIDAPTYTEYEYDPEVEEEYIEEYWNHLGDSMTEKNITNADGTTSQIKGDVYVSFKTNDEWTRPDKLQLDFYAETDYDQFALGHIAFQYAEIAPSDNSWAG